MWERDGNLFGNAVYHSDLRVPCLMHMNIINMHGRNARWEVTRQPLANSSSERHLKQQLLPIKIQRQAVPSEIASQSVARWLPTRSGCIGMTQGHANAHSVFGGHKRERVAEADAYPQPLALQAGSTNGGRRPVRYNNVKLHGAHAEITF